jgi:hypothetical protein
LETLLENINCLNSKEDPLTPLSFMNITTEVMNFLDLNNAYKNIVDEERKEAEYQWIYTEPVNIEAKNIQQEV